MSLPQRLGVGGCEKNKVPKRLRRENEYGRCILNDELANRRSEPISLISSAVADQLPTYPSCIVTLASIQAGRFTDNNDINLQI